MDQSQLEALLAQMGALGPNDFREEIKKEKVKEQTSEFSAPTEVEKDVTYRTWIKPGTNRRLTVKVNGDGTYTKTFDGADPDIKPTASDPTTPAGRTAAANATEAETKAAEATRIRNESSWNADPANRANGGSGRYEDHATRDARLAKEKSEAEAKARQDKLDADAAAARNAPKPVSTNTTEPYIVQAGPDGKLITSPNPNYVGEKPQRSTVKGSDGKTYVVSVDKDGNATAKPVEGLPAEPSGAEPAGSPTPSGRLGEAAADLRAYDEWLGPQVRSGKMTPAQADKLREARRSFWDTAIKEQQGVVNAQQAGFNSQNTQRSSTMADLSNRRANETNIALNAGKSLEDLGDKLGGGAAPAAGLSQAIRNARIDASNFVTMSGANRMVPEIAQPPAVQTVMGMGLPYGTSTMPGLNVRPNAIGAVTNGVTSTNAAATNPTGANVDAANTATQAGFQQAVAPLLAPQPPVDGAPQAVMAPSSPYFLAGASRGHVPDPTRSIQEMIADPDIDNNAVRQAVAEMYPGYPIDQLLAGRAA